MTQEHERGLGGWQAEWETLPEIFLLTSGALYQMREVVAGLHVDTGRMWENLEKTAGLIYAESVSAALARVIGRAAAHELVESACRSASARGLHLLEVVTSTPEITEHLSADALKSLFDPDPQVRAAARLVDRALAAVSNSFSAVQMEGSPCSSQK
jgi:3-carboxy-cis,cis-muconate cycloisomerase